MDRRTIRAIEAKAAQIRRPFRINPDLIVRWGLLVGAFTGAAVGLAVCLADGLPWIQAGEAALGGAFIGTLLVGVLSVVISVLYEMLMGVVDFAARFRKTKPVSTDNEDI
jgi:hypothetical protein